MDTLNIAFFGSSLVSAYWNGAATYYRGIIKELHRRGHRITFYEPDAYGRQQHRDLPEVEWATSVVFAPLEAAADELLEQLEDFDVIIKTSGMGVLDTYLEKMIPLCTKENQLAVFWDVDAPATLAAAKADVENNFKQHIDKFDLVLTYGGGNKIVKYYLEFGARACYPVYNALDPETHFPENVHEEFACDLFFLGNRLPDREQRVEEFFMKAAQIIPSCSFIIGGNGWENKNMPENIRKSGHVYTRDHNAINSSAKVILNISRDSMAETGFSPATRVFEAAGAGACIITDDWEGIDFFFEPGTEILVAKSGEDVAELVKQLSREQAKQIGAAARQRALRDHTYAQRAAVAEKILRIHLKEKREELV